MAELKRHMDVLERVLEGQPYPIRTVNSCSRKSYKTLICEKL
ncbi:hypothetical protein MARSALSMR5_00727 [Marinobacter salarius]|jgi:predicted transcriptional regulator|uniref:Uncharacterized protein n=1 Tax=Marinobacter salarius TaxID=1420917 RepID=A0A1W6K5X6_9GAMM|nr:hypothetical protein MARSALSMR5_00727 [Marinobacter salarius]